MPRSPQLQDAVDDYLRLKAARCAASTMGNERSQLQRFAGQIGRHRPVESLTSEDLENYFFGQHGLVSADLGGRGIHEQGMQPASINKVRNRLQLFFKHCQARGWLRCDPLATVRPLRVPRKDRLRLTAAELVALLDHAGDPRDRGMLAVAINLGLRASEITMLKLGDLDLAAGDLRVWMDKTDEVDMMPINADLDMELRRWLTQYGVEHDSALEAGMFLFPARARPRFLWQDGARSTRLGALQPEQRLTRHAAQVVQRALTNAGVEDVRHQGFHTIRRSVGRFYFDRVSEQGHDAALRQTSALLHHKNAATTELYLGLDREKRKRDESLRGRPFLSAGLNLDGVTELDKRRSSARHG